MEHGVLAGLANQKHAIGEDLVAVGSSGFSPDLIFAIDREACDCLAPGDIAIAGVVKADPLAVFRDAKELDGFGLVGARQLLTVEPLRASRRQRKAKDCTDKQFCSRIHVDLSCNAELGKPLLYCATSPVQLHADCK